MEDALRVTIVGGDRYARETLRRVLDAAGRVVIDEASTDPGVNQEDPSSSDVLVFAWQPRTRQPVSVRDVLQEWSRRCDRAGLTLELGWAHHVVDGAVAAILASDSDNTGDVGSTGVDVWDRTDDDPTDVGEALLRVHELRGALRSLAARMPTGADQVDEIIDRIIATLVSREIGRLREQSLTDPLTGLGNRRAFENTFISEVARADRYSRPLSTVMVDLDGLKRINDTDGHQAGDRALQRLADSVRRSLRASDLCFRLGGDEFVILLPETRKEQVSDVIKRLAGAGVPAFTWGASTYLDDTAEASEVLAIADRQLIARRRAVRS